MERALDRFDQILQGSRRMSDPPIKTFKEQPISREISENDEFAECHE